ncbi:MAG: hypothetical protein HY531_02395 [Chloroflexi bacterium]|nr:hypothetical protein [Chloroflexota bacterium]
MVSSPTQWRQQVKARLATLQQALAQFKGAPEERIRLLHRIAMLEREIRLLEEDDQQWGTQWVDEETGAAADMWFSR